MKRVVLLTASGLGTGYFPIVPGSVGTIPAWVIAYFWLGRTPWALWAGAVVVTAISVWSAGAAERFLGHDSKKIVIDEWAGMLISVLFLPYRLDVYLAAFVLFRFYDVIKPFPAGYCEQWPGGWGVTFDDVAAAVYANLTCWLGIRILGLVHWFGF